LPSGRPPEESVTLVEDDPTWALEYRYFKEICSKKGQTDLRTDCWLNESLSRLGKEALELLVQP